MKKGKAGIFTLSSTSLMICECLISIVVIFLDTFLVSKLMQLTPGDYTNVSLFNFIYYAVLAVTVFAFTPLLLKINKSLFMSIGALFLAGTFIAVYLLNDQLSNFIWLFGILSGFSYGLFCAGFNNLIGEVISSKHQTIYFSVKNIVIFLTKTIFPFILGAVIDLGSFAVLCIVIAVICVMMLIFSFLVKPKNSVKKSYNMIKFWKLIKQGKEETKPLKLLYLSGFFRGLCFDLIATVFTILIFLQYSGSDFTIGLLQTIFTATQMISMFLFMKFYHKNRSQWFIFISLGLIVASSIPVFISHNTISILIFYGVYMFFRVFITTVTDMRKTPIIRLLSMHSHTLEHNSTYSIIYGLTRASSYLSLLLFFVVPEWIMINITLAINIFGYIGYSITLYLLERKLILQDIKWKKEHPDPVITQDEKTEISEKNIEVLPKEMERIEIKKS